MQRYVIDSSVFNKLYLDEPDRDKAQRLFVKAAATEIMLFAPDLLYLEVVNTAQRCGCRSRVIRGPVLSHEDASRHQ